MPLRSLVFGSCCVAHSVSLRKRPAVAVALLLVLCAGSLVGCGVAPGGGTSATGTKTVTKTVTNGCPIGSGGGVVTPAPTLVLTVKDANHESRAHVGDVMQVRLPGNQRWTLEKSGEGALEVLQPAGYWDGKASACIWNFKAETAGTTTVSFVGTAICEPGQVCPAYAVLETFLVTVV